MNDTTIGRAPQVTVVIPVRNCMQFVGEAIASVLNQSHRDLELLLVDDGSTDGDYRQFETRDARLRVIRLEGLGVSRARNTGMRQARGAIIAFLDADDVWFPGKLEAQVRYLRTHPDVGVVFGGFIRWRADEAGQFTPASELMSDCSGMQSNEALRSGWLYTRLLNGLLVGMNTAVIRREVYEAIGGFNEAMRQGEDYDFWLKASRLYEMHALDGNVALYRIHPSSAMHRVSEENHLALLLTAAQLRWGLSNPDGQLLDPGEFKRRLGRVYFDHGYEHYWKGSRKTSVHAFRKALGLGYMKLRSAAYIALSLISLAIKNKPNRNI